MTSFRSKITRRKRKLSGGTAGINNVQQYIAAKLVNGWDSLIADEAIVTSINPTEMLNKRKSDSAKFYAYNAFQDPKNEVAYVYNAHEETKKYNALQEPKNETMYEGIKNRCNTEMTKSSCNGHADPLPRSDDVDQQYEGIEIRQRTNLHSTQRLPDGYTAKNTKKANRSNVDNENVKYKPTDSSLYRSRQSQKESEPKMQYKPTDTTEKVDNKRPSKSKKKKKDAGPVKPTPQNGVVVDDKKNKQQTKDVTNDSYLKRVKSKIYKHSRSDSNVSQNSSEGTSDGESKTKQKKMKEKKTNAKNVKVSVCDNIPEESEVKLKKSASTIFLRQYSNLERVRPKTFGVRSSGGFLGISDLVDSTTNILHLPVEQPKLTKSKSSSAINLNLLRARRNKTQEQSKNCKNADTEFSFISYPVPPNASVLVSRKFDRSAFSELIPVEQKENRPSSWIIGEGRFYFIKYIILQIDMLFYVHSIRFCCV